MTDINFNKPDLAQNDPDEDAADTVESTEASHTDEVSVESEAPADGDEVAHVEAESASETITEAVMEQQEAPDETSSENVANAETDTSSALALDANGDYVAVNAVSTDVPTNENVDNTMAVEQQATDEQVSSNGTGTTPTATGTVPLARPLTKASAFANLEANPNRLEPASSWPPPIYFDSMNATDQERFYIEHRWYAQWSYYDKKASEAKRMYQRLQLTIGLGSVIVPVLVGLNEPGTIGNTLRYITVAISLMVAAAAAIETVKTYGDNWRTFRAAAEELKREKSLYDVMAGPYRRTKNPFLLFVERSEDIMAKQNGAWIALREEQSKEKEEENAAAIESISGGKPTSNGTTAATTTASDGYDDGLG